MNINNINVKNDLICCKYSNNKNLVKSLPHEIFLKTLSDLDNMDMKQACLVSHIWNKASIYIEKHKNFSLIKVFANFLSRNISQDLNDYRKNFLSIGYDNKILNSIDLILIKNSIIETKESFLIVLENLNEQDLKTLEGLYKNEIKPKYFKNIFDLERVYKRISESNKISNEIEKTFELQDISKVFIEMDMIRKSIEIANAIPDERIKFLTIRDIFKALTKKSNVDIVTEIANAIPDEKIKSLALRGISEALMEMGDRDKAIEITNAIPTERIKSYVNKGISETLKKGETENPLEG